MALLVVSFVVVMAAEARAFYQIYLSYGVEGHPDDAAPSAAIWLALTVEILGAVGCFGAVTTLARAGLLRWWSWRG